MKKHIALVLALATSGYGALAQSALKIAPGKVGMYPVTVEFVPGQEPEFVKGTVLLKEQNSYVPSKDVILKQSEIDQIGQEHYRYQQVINSIPVENAIYAVHVAAGKIKSQNGEWIASPSAGLPTAPAISEKVALEAAMKAFGAKSYKWQFPAEEAFIKAESGDEAASFLPKAELVYYSGEKEVSAAKMRLAYKLDLYAHEPIGRRTYFVDAITGAILGKREVMHTANAAGTAVTGYSGTQAITTDSYGGGYRLRETSRGKGIQTFNMKNSNNYSLAADFTDADNYWNNANSAKDQFATDAHWGAEMTYDYYKNTFGRNSIDNAGYAIKSYVHYGVNYFNAFWDGSRMTYGDGSATNGFRPLTSVDICGHEITHGVISNTASLTYAYESGALNEGFADIFGTAIEFYAKGSSADWLFGDSHYAYRSMANPKAYGQPDTYQGVNWATGTADNGGVHTNSGVVNYWFYLLAQGGSGTNDHSYSYSVSGIGLAKAAAIAYRTLTLYLTPTSQYANACSYSILAATDLYGASSAEVASVRNAWKAVGVSEAVQETGCDGDNYESNNSISTGFVIATNTDVKGLIDRNTDKDWFTITTTNAAPKLKITLEELGADIDMKLYSAAKKVIGSSTKGSLLDESIVYNAATTGATYYVYLYGFNGQYNADECYKLRVATSSVNQLLDSEDEQITDEQGAFKKPMIDEFSDVVTVFPNPAKEKLTVTFSADQTGSQAVSISDLVGRVIVNQSFDVLEGSNTFTLPLDNYRTGIYFLNVAGKPAVKFMVTE